MYFLKIVKGDGGEGDWGLIWEKFQKKLPPKSQALLGLNLMGFTDLFYKQVSFHFLQGRLFHSNCSLKAILSAV